MVGTGKSESKHLFVVLLITPFMFVLILLTILLLDNIRFACGVINENKIFSFLCCFLVAKYCCSHVASKINVFLKQNNFSLSQRWTDKRVSWNPADYNDTTQVIINDWYVWKPDIQMWNR